MSTLPRLTCLLWTLTLPLAAFATEPATLDQLAARHFHSGNHASSPLVDKVRRATAKYRDINAMFAEGGWAAATPCVSGPNAGAMGVHFVKDGRIGDGILKADEPEALIYEPLGNGFMRLVGVEFIEIKDVWDSIGNGGGKQPTLEGLLLNLVGTPNRYTLPAFYELHVWAWKDNPDGFFVDWNTEVNCNQASVQ